MYRGTNCIMKLNFMPKTCCLSIISTWGDMFDLGCVASFLLQLPQSCSFNGFPSIDKA